MPIENELKYVLKLDCEPVISKFCKRKSILQGYLQASNGTSTRVRKIVTTEDVDYRFTFKYKVNWNKVIEIEKKISKDDFDILWDETWCRLEKIRYTKKIDNITWDVDFFKNKSIYFVLAEAEMPEDMVIPPEKNVPFWINDNLLYAVPLENGNFSSRKLADVEYAKNLLKKI